MSNSRDARNHRQSRRQLTRGYRHVLEEGYHSVTSWSGKYSAFEASKKATNGCNPLFLARAAFELAATANSPRAQCSLLMESVDRTARLVASPPLDLGLKVQLAILHANLPLLNLIHIEKKQPDLPVVERAHTQLARTMLGLYGARANSHEKQAEFAGAAAEAYTIINLQRFQTQELGSTDWTAVPSLLSEDNSSHVGSVVRHTWDASIFTGVDEQSLADPTYKVQVKSNRLAALGMSYDQSISVIHLRDDLRLPHEKKIPTLAAIGLCACAHVIDSPNSQLIAKAEARTSLLVNALDR